MKDVIFWMKWPPPWWVWLLVVLIVGAAALRFSGGV
jgi:hypothetical protein